MSSGPPLDLAAARVLLLDADGILFDSEGLAFEASAAVTNAFLDSLGVAERLTPSGLRLQSTGKNFRTTARELALAFGAREPTPAELETWVAREREAVTAHLAAAVKPDPSVTAALVELGRRFRLAVVSSSARARVLACIEASGLSFLLSPQVVFSAEDSLPVPSGKPDPAVYRFAGARLGVRGDEAVAIEDSEPGVRSAVGAGFPAIGNLQFVPAAERPTRTGQLLDAGASTVVESWPQLVARLSEARPARRTAGVAG